MLHELFVALAGHPSPLFDPDQSSQFAEYISPSEQSLLSSLAQLGRLHSLVRDACKDISLTHKSVVCRSVASAILSDNLSQFHAKVVQVESSILRKSTDIVGAYGIVPLSSIAVSFDGWQRLLQWLEVLVTTMQVGAGADAIANANAGANTDIGGTLAGETRQPKTRPCTGAELIKLLDRETHTGYPNIREASIKLLKIAEATWFRQLAGWLLYGLLPAPDESDLFIRARGTGSGTGTNVKSNENVDFVLQPDLIPFFVDAVTARSVLFIGRSLQYIQKRVDGGGTGETGVLEQARASILQEHTNLLHRIDRPIQSQTLSKVVAQMRVSLSRKALQKLLPMSEIVMMLRVLRDFMLLERGEFAVALIETADRSLDNSRKSTPHHRESDRLHGMMLKSSEVKSVLSSTWMALAARQSINDESEDEALELARSEIHIDISKVPSTTLTSLPVAGSRSNTNTGLFDDLLLAIPTRLRVAVTQPQDLFLSNEDVEVYSRINSYLLSVRRANIHLSQLWQLAALRKGKFLHGASSQRSDMSAVARHEQHLRAMRGIWTIASRTLFFFSQFGEYFQGEVVAGCTNAFDQWLGTATSEGDRQPLREIRIPEAEASTQGDTDREKQNAQLSGQKQHSRAGSDSFEATNAQSESTPARDPEAVTAAHRIYLRHMQSVLLIDDGHFTTTLRNLLTRVDHLVALTSRLATIATWSAAETQPSSSNSASDRNLREELDLIRSLDAVRKSMSTSMDDLIVRLNELDEAHRSGVFDISPNEIENSLSHNILSNSDFGAASFRPWKGASITRLLMRLEPDGSKDMSK